MGSDFGQIGWFKIQNATRTDPSRMLSAIKSFPKSGYLVFSSSVRPLGYGVF
jgi:hypothetical protein